MLKWIYLDFNSYFASVEQQLNPELRGKPIAVVPMIADNTSVIAASYEAKAFGIKTGTLVSEAKKMCPGLILVNSGHGPYIDFHHKIIEVVDEVMPVDRVCSIDELAFELKGSQKDRANAIRLAQQLKDVIHQKVGEVIHCSIGIAPNRWIAKIAADMQKPNGLTIIEKSELPHRLKILKLRDLPGIGFAMEERLRKHMVFSMGDLLALDEKEFRQVWGNIHGVNVYRWLRGEETEEVATRTRSISHSHVLPPEDRNWKSALDVIKKLTHKAAVRLRREGYWTARLSIDVSLLPPPGERKAQDFRSVWGRSAGARYFDQSVKLMETQDTRELISALNELWKSHPEDAQPLKVGMVLSDLTEDAQHTPSLFEDPRRALMPRLLDEINQKFGKDKVYFGAIHDVRDSARTLIAFTRIPKADEF
ncbi:MAG: hypothetical protein KA715_11600 [Xanthomonadaceae bacterium]|nr:hypothetical protein [Xanthomonadaceae bacterium]